MVVRVTSLCPDRVDEIESAQERITTMSWMDRLKGAVGGGDSGRSARGGDAASQVEVREFNLPPVEGVDPTSISDGEVRELLCADLVGLADGKLGRHDIDDDGHLFDFGYVDSLSAVAFIARIEERFGVHIEDFELLDGVSTLNEIVSRIRTN